MATKTSENTKQNIVIDKNGNLKLVNADEPLLAGEIVIESDSDGVSVEVTDSSGINDDINAILSAISDGEDPSLVSEAPAVGENSGSSLTVSTEIERIGKSTIAETNFDTSSLESTGLSRTQSLTLLEQYKVYRETGEFQLPDSSNGLAKTAPSISIAEIDENGVINEANAANGIQIEVRLPAGTEKGDMIELRDGKGTVVGEHKLTETDITNGKVEITVPTPENDGDYEYVADITDPSGDTGPRSNEVEFELDTKVLTETDGDGDAGITSDITDATNSGSNEDTITNDATPNITGVTEAGASVTITYTDKAGATHTTAAVTADANGVYTIAITNELAEGSNSLTVKAEDAAGNSTETTQDVTVDTKVLTETDGDGDAGITSDITDATNSGSNEDTITNDATPNITGVTEAGASVTITYTDKAGATHTTAAVTADANGVYTIAITNELAEGSNSLTVKAEDAAGNSTETTQDVTVDTKVLTETDGDGDAGITSDITDATNSGSNEDTITNDATPNITGVTEAGASVTITYTDKAGATHTTAAVTADANGVYTIAITNELAEGSNSLTVKAEDAAGNSTETTQDVTVDTKVLTETDGDGDAGITSDITDATNSGSNEDTITNDATPNITGVTEAGASVTITYTDKAGATHTTAAVTADANGVYTIAITNELAEGSNSLTVKAEDAAGNSTETTQDVTVDTKVLTETDGDGDAGITSDITDATNSGSNEDTITNDATPNITGVTEAGASVTITYTDKAGATHTTAAVTADANGVYTIAITNELAEGSNSLTVKAEDAAGNSTETTQDVTVDTKVLTETDGDGDAGITSDITDATNSGSNEDTITNDATPNITGVTEAGASVTITYTDKAGATHTTAAVTADANGVYTIAITNELAEGSNSLTVKAEDAAGNSTETTQDVTVDTKVLTETDGDGDAGITSDITDATNSGSNEDTITNDATPNITGVTEAGASVTITYTDKAGATHTTAAVTADANGVYTIAITNELAEGSNSLTVKAEDAAGNSTETTQDVTVDTKVLTETDGDGDAGITSDITDATNSGSNEDTITNDATPNITGVTEAGASVTITYTDKAGATHTTAAVTADANGVYTIAITNELAEGSNSLTVKAEDAAGNSTETTQDVTVDTKVLTETDGDGDAGITSDITDATNSGSNEDTITNDATPNITGVTEAGASVTITYTDKAGATHTTAAVTADANGVYTIAITNELAEGSNSLTVKAEDAAGNSTETTQDVTVDTKVLTETDGDGDAGITSDITDATNSGSNEDTITNDATPNITGVTEAGASVTITYTDKAGATHTTAAVTADANGVYTIAITNELAEGSNSLTVKAEDAAGNSTETTQDVTVDTKVLTETDGDGDAGITSDITDATNSGSNEDTITNDATPNITGVTEAGASVTITYTDKAGATHTTAAVTADANGVYTIAITNELAEGSNSLTVKAEDAAGNSTETTQDVTVDTKVLTETDGDGDAGITSDITDATNSGSNEDTITNDATPNITGVTEAGASVTITYTDKAGATHTTAAVTADANGVYTIAITNELAEGSNSLTVKAEDAAGNSTETTQDVTVDTKVLTETDGDGDAGITSDITDATNSGSNEDTITNDATPNITGVTEAGASVTITYTDKAGATHTTAAVTADANGVYTIAITNELAEGSNSLTVKAEDAAGNSTETTQDVTVDTKVLTETDGDGDAGITSDITDATNSGSNEDTITNDATPNITGVTEAGASVTITYTDKAGATHTTAAVTADANGVYTIAITNELAEGSNSLTVKAEDAAGNSTETTQDVTVDTKVLTETDGDGDAGITSDITDATNSGSNEDTITNDATPNITGVTEAGASVTITYTDKAGATHTTAAVTADANGVYTIAITNELAEGSNSLTVKAEDAAGNSTETTQDVTVDTKVLTETDGDGDAGITSDITDATNSGSNEDTITNDATPNITGVTEAGASVTITYTDKAGATHTTAAVTADANGVYTIAITNELAEGSNSLTVKAEDAAGNSTETTQDVTVNSDPIATDFEITLTDDTSVQFTFAPHVSDIEDDASATDDKSVVINITALPEFGTLYLVDGDSRTEITATTVLTEDSQIEYELNDKINDDLSFNATEDFASDYNNGTVTSFTLPSGVIVSGGTYSGTRPDTTSTLTADELYYDSAVNETGLGVGNSEIDVNSKDYIEVDFTDVGNANTTDVDIKEVNIDFGSVFGNYSENSNANAEIHILLFKDGVLVGESPYIFDDETHNVYDGSGEFTANIQLDSGFDQIRVYTVHGEGSTASNSNVTLQGVEVVDAMVSEDIPYQATDSDDATDTSIITVSTDSTERAINNAPVIGDSVFNATDEDVAIPLNLEDLLITDLDGDDITLTNIMVDPVFGSLELIFNGDEVIGAQFMPAENVHFDSNNAVEFEITVTDGYQSSTGTATLIVNAIADEPTLSVVLGESVIAGPGFDTSDVNSIKDFFANGGTIPGIGNVVYSGEMVLGDDGNNLIIGTGVVNNLIGDSVAGTGNDVFVGGSNNDSIYGGTGPLDSGIDGVIYSGKISEYLIVNQGGAHGGGVDHWVVTDTLGRDTGYDHTAPEDNGDQLYQIERLIFSDAIVELNPDGTYTILQETETTLDLSASVMDIDGSEYLDAINISGLPAGAQIFDKDTNQPLGEFKEINGEQIWVIDIIGQDTQTVNYDNLVVRYPSAETLDIDVSAVAKESSNNSEATTTVNASPSQDIYADQGGETPTTLISLVLDSSGSMDHKPFKSDDSNPDQDKTRMELVLEASIAMLNNVKSQEGSEEVLVQLVDFDNQKHHSEDENAESLGWFTVQNAINALNAALVDIANENEDEDFYPDGGTDYEEGIYAVISGYQDSQVTDITGETNDVVYFFSDGNNDGGWQGGNNGPKDIWEDFIIGKDVTAIGIVRDENTTLSGLNKISDKVIYLTDGQLLTELPKLRPTIGQAGALLMGIIGLDAAAIIIDETKTEVLRVIDHNGVISSSTYTVTKDGNQLLIDTEYGDLRIEEDGSYYFQPSLSAPVIESGKSVAFEVIYTTESDNGVENQQLVTLNISPSGEVNATATSSLNASTGDDVVVGTDSDDIILGHEGNDILIGGLGDDILVGGAGEDIFKWVDQGADSGTDTIKDFTVGEDLIDLTEIISGFDDEMSMADLLGHIQVSENGDDLTLSITDDAGNAHEIIVEGAVDSFGLEDANFSNQSEILTKLLNDQMFKLDDIT